MLVIAKYFRYIIDRLRISNIRSFYYKLFYQIGSHCHFQKITFYRPPRFHTKKDSIQIGNSVCIFRNTEIIGCDGYPVIIKDHTFINQDCRIRPNVTIGRNVCIAMGVSIISDTHEIGPADCRAGKQKFLPIEIGDGCWIGANSTILGGVIIGNGTIIGAGSLVNKDCEPNCLYAGVPAKLIKRLE